jgi:lysozyme
MINYAGMALLREFEGCRLEAYLDTLAKPAVWTIGYGYTGSDVHEGLKWSQEKAEMRLREWVLVVCTSIEEHMTVKPNENQLAAMVCLAYNIGIGGFRRSSVLRLHNSGKFAEAASAFGMWNKAGGKVRAGLTRRRAAEAALYLTPVTPAAQTTRAVPDVKDPVAKPPVAAIAAGAGAILTGAQQFVAQVASVWDGLSDMGISPHVLLAVLGSLALGLLLWFAYDAYRRNSEGDR